MATKRPCPERERGEPCDMLVAFAYPDAHPLAPRGACGFHRKAGMAPLPTRTAERRSREDLLGVQRRGARI